MSIISIVEQDAVKLPAGVHVPDGTPVRLEFLRPTSGRWPADYFERTAGSMANEIFERPDQGELPVRETW